MGKTRPGLHCLPLAMMCLFVCARPSYVEKNNEPTCLKFFLPFLYHGVFHFISLGERPRESAMANPKIQTVF